MTLTPPGQGPGATGATFAWGAFRPFAFLAAPTSPEYEAPPSKDQSQGVSGRPRDYSRGRLRPVLLGNRHRDPLTVYGAARPTL